LERFPVGFTADEAAQGYTAYSILKTGKDEWGVKLPLNPRSFGDFKAPLQTYLIIPSISIFGLSELGVRLPNAIFGSLAVIIVYFLAKELFSSSLLAFSSSLLLAISPWHTSLSRGAFEANLTTFFLPLGVLFFLWGLKSPNLLLVSAFFFGVNLLTYHSAKFVTPLVLVTLVFQKREEFQQERLMKHIFIYVSWLLILAVFALVAGYSLLGGGGIRASDIGFFSGGWNTVSEKRYFAVTQGLPDFLSRIFNNKLTFLSNEFVKNYLSYLSPQFFFTQGAGEATYGMIPGVGLLYQIELLFLLSSFYFLIKEKRQEMVFLWIWILLSPFPASLARGVGYHANRVAVMMPAIQILSAYGLWKLIDAFQFYTKAKQFFRFCLLVLCFSFLSFAQEYFFQAPKINAPKMGYGWRQAATYLGKKPRSKVIISRSFSEPQSMVMFYKQIDPHFVQRNIQPWLKYQEEGKFFIDQLGEYSLGNFKFRNFSFPEDWEETGVTFVGNESDFLIQEKEIEKNKRLNKIKSDYVINFPDGRIAIRIIEL